MIRQGDYYQAKTDLVIGRCKPRQGDIFWITSPTYRNLETVAISRKGKGSLNQGYIITVEQLRQYFEKVN